MAAALTGLNIAKNKEIIENVLYLGMLKKTEEVLGITGEGIKGDENAGKSI
jgi:hypothetical protein